MEILVTNIKKKKKKKYIYRIKRDKKIFKKLIRVKIKVLIFSFSISLLKFYIFICMDIFFLTHF